MQKHYTFPVMAATLMMHFSAFALEQVDDSQLSNAVGQTGIIISTSVDWVSSSVKISDLSGVPSTIKPGYEFNTGVLVLNGMGIKGCTNGAGLTCTTTTNPTFNVTVDASGGASPVVKLAVAWDSGIQKLRILLDKVSIHNQQGGNVVEILDFANGYLDLLRPGAPNPTFNFELGNEPSTHMMTLANANFGTLDFGQVLLRDKSDNLSNNRNIRFNFKLDGMNLTGTTVDIANAGLILTTPNLTAVDMTLSNITAGNTAANMGSMGVVGMNLSNLTFTIAGKS